MLMAKEMICSTCKADLRAEKDFAVFKCPSCGEAEIGRCSKCKRLSNRYVCPKCGFAGP